MLKLGKAESVPAAFPCRKSQAERCLGVWMMVVGMREFGHLDGGSQRMTVYGQGQ